VIRTSKTINLGHEFDPETEALIRAALTWKSTYTGGPGPEECHGAGPAYSHRLRLRKAAVEWIKAHGEVVQ
jgi:hypothetical protein